MQVDAKSSLDFTPLLSEIKRIVKEEIDRKNSEKLEGLFMSPKEVCKLFNPKISIVTLSSWTKAGRFKMYRMNSRTYYKYAEVMKNITVDEKYKKL